MALRLRNGISIFGTLSVLTALNAALVTAAGAQALPGDVATPSTVSPTGEQVPAIHQITVAGVRALDSALVQKAALAAVVGEPGSSETIKKATLAVTDLYKSRGFPVAAVVAVNLRPDGTLDLTVAEGTIRRILIRGNRKTKASTVLQALSLRPGQIYDEEQVRADRNRLSHLGIFDEIIISAQVPGTEETEKPLNSIGGKSGGSAPPTDRSDGPTPSAASAAGDGAAPTASGPPPTTQSGAPETRPNSPNPDAPVGVPPAPNPDAPTLPGGGPSPASKITPAPMPVLAELAPGDDEVGQVDLVVRVKEKATVNIAATVGYSDAIGPVGFVDVREVNLAGTAQRVGLQWQRVTNAYLGSDGSVQRGDSRQAFDLTFERPMIGAKSTAFTVDFYDKNTVFLPYFSGVDDTIRTYEKRHGLSASVGHSIGHNLAGYLLMRREDIGYDPISPGFAGTLPPVGLFLGAAAKVSALGMALVGDGRDAVDNPRRGYFNSVRYENAGTLFGGNRTFGQGVVDLRHYSPINASPDGPILAFRFVGGYSTGNVPLPEFFFIGGYDLLRGYDLYSIYGDRMVVGTGEVRTKLSEGVQGVVFVDDGNAWLPGTAASLRGLRAGAGIGLRFMSPIGPIRFDAAYGSSLKTYVTLGQSF
jgi:outer membrane protein assembly factor BamA